MNFRDYTFVAFLLFGISFTTVYGLQCYVCNSINPGEEDCGSLKVGSTKFLKNCTEPHDKSCRKQDQWVDFEVLKQTTNERTIRQCASSPYDPDRPCYFRSGFGGKINVCNCEGDRCNEASRTVSTIFLSIVLLFLLSCFS